MQVKLQNENQNEKITAAPSPVSVAASAPKFHPVTGAAGSENATMTPSAIKSVGYYTACPVTSCDRCGTGIKHVFPVTLKDGSVFRYGSECINKILSGDNSLLALWKKNSKLLQRLQRDLEVLSRPWSDIPVGKVAINAMPGSCRRFVSCEDNGAWIAYIGGMMFHPNHYSEDEFDGKQNRWYHGAFHFNTLAQFHFECENRRVEFTKHLQTEIARIELFLGRVIAKGLIKS